MDIKLGMSIAHFPQGFPIDARSKFEKGYIVIQTERPYYYGNNLVTGNVYVRATEYIDAKELVIAVRGREAVSWEELLEVKGTDQKEKYRACYTHLDFNQTVLTFQEGLAPGDYSFGFEFTLPADVPSSMIYQNKDHDLKPEIKIKYKIKAEIHTE